MAKVIIAGSRNLILDDDRLNRMIEYTGIVPTEVVCGEAKGPDSYGKEWALENSIPVASFPAKWDKYGKQAGILRNKQMGDYADALFAFWDGKSRGTKHMIDYMSSLNKEFYVEVLTENNKNS